MKNYYIYRMLRFAFILLLALFYSCNTRNTHSIYQIHPQKVIRLVPVIEDDWWEIGPEPDLRELGLQPDPSDIQPNQPNDHHIFLDKTGKWHLWACVRETKVGRILCHWQADSIRQSPWTFTGEIIRADKSFGESQVEWKGQEFIQSPFIVEKNDTFRMIYGGYDSGIDADGNTINPALDYNNAEKQICLMESTDGLHWTRYTNENGYSRVFLGPGAARDPCLIKIKSTWYCYYCGHHNRDRTCGAIYVRTSKDLITWSDWEIAHYDKAHEGHKWVPESPCVVFRNGYYYLFRSHGELGGTYVYRSENPKNFGHGDVSGRFVRRFDDILANEIIVDKHGNEYITSITDGEKYGIRMTYLKWIPAEK